MASGIKNRRELAGSEARWLGWVTPFGGVALMLGWASLAVLAFRR